MDQTEPQRFQGIYIRDRVRAHNVHMLNRYSPPGRSVHQAGFEFRSGDGAAPCRTRNKLRDDFCLEERVRDEAACFLSPVHIFELFAPGIPVFTAVGDGFVKIQGPFNKSVDRASRI